MVLVVGDGERRERRKPRSSVDVKRVKEETFCGQDADEAIAMLHFKSKKKRGMSATDYERQTREFKRKNIVVEAKENPKLISEFIRKRVTVREQTIRLKDSEERVAEIETDISEKLSENNRVYSQ